MNPQRLDCRWVLEDLEWDASTHEVTVVAAAGVVAVQRALELGLELAHGIEALAVERRSVELLDGCALEARTPRCGSVSGRSPSH
ncbi:MAG TPA: hypothetical protein VK988_02995 [Acidimicrobiales bacterium]|nr:hypothetical protein [Acidimicrobiales bacterium]